MQRLTITGPIDGVNPTFTLSAAPAAGSAFRLYRNGALQKLAVDFTLAGTTVTFLADSIPQVDDTLQALAEVA